MFNEVYLTNYCPTDNGSDSNNNCQPVKSITQLSKDQAFDMAKKLHSNAYCTGFRRFGDDFSDYYHFRLKVESWLYDSFVRAGGKPEISHPFYFVLDESHDFYQIFGEGISTKIRLGEIAKEHISFTFGDSMATFEKEGYSTPLFTLAELKKMLGKQSISQFIESIKEQYVIIEAQLWSDRYHSKMLSTRKNMEVI